MRRPLVDHLSWPLHSPHNYRVLVERWRAVARGAGLRLQRLSQAGRLDVYYLRTRALTARRGIYISAGIHGDEPATTEALIAWAERRMGQLAELPLLLFPCLNPWGLMYNRRTDAQDADLNRLFHREDQPVLQALKTVVAPFQFEVALLLHEDYDGLGLYAYEIKSQEPFWGEALLESARLIIPIDPRRQIDGRKAAGGLIRRRFDARRFAEIGYPEAIWLHRFHARRAITVETPSEAALELRVTAHIAILDECVRRVLANHGVAPKLRNHAV